ncbi:MAG TPA: translocation/assembly module TamB domain-containing protein [Labilithrix sp.]
MGRFVARVLCVVFALCGLVPVGIGLLVRTSWARGIATAETRKVLTGFGVDARYELELRVWPLSVGLRNLRVNATDGGSPFLTAQSATAKPKIFGLLAGKLVIDEIEIEKPSARIVMHDGKITNLSLKLPETEKKTENGPWKAPFSVVSASDAKVDLFVDDTHVVADSIDADVTADDDGEGGNAFEVALRAATVKSRIVRTLKPATDAQRGEYAVDEDLLCRIDGRARIEKTRLLVRRFSAHGAADLDPKEDTQQACSLSPDDKRYVEVALGHLTVVYPQDIHKDPPAIDGHVKARAPLGLVNRLKGTPDIDGWAAVDVEVRVDPKSQSPGIFGPYELAGSIDAGGVRVTRFAFAKQLHSEIVVRRSVATSAYTRIVIGDGVAEVRDIEVKLVAGFPLKARLDAVNVDFTTLMRELGVSKTPHVAWDLKEVHVANAHGTIDPLTIDGDLTAKTQNFVIYTAPVESNEKTRATGVQRGDIVGKLAVRPTALEFHHCTVTTGRSHAQEVLVAIGYHDSLRVEVPTGKIDLADLSPLGSVAIGGVADVKATVIGTLGDPKIEGDLGIDKFTLGEKESQLSFGSISQAHALMHAEELAVNLTDVRASKNKSSYEMPTGRLDFKGPAHMRLDGTVTSKNMDVRDFFSVFHLDEDPRFEQIGGTLEANARLHIALGGPEDVCHGGFLDVQAVTTAHQLNLLGEKFDEGSADVEYRWIDRAAGIEGAEIDVRSLSLTKLKKENRASIGSVLGAITIHRGGQLRGNLVLQGLPLSRIDVLGGAAKDIEGSASGIARVGGTLSAFDIETDLSVSAVRVFGAPFGSSDVHVTLTQNPEPQKPIGKTACGADITPSFDKDAYLAGSASRVDGMIGIDGKLFGGQVKLDNVRITRQKFPVATGKVTLDGFDLAPVGKIVVGGDAEPDAQSALGGILSGAIDLEKIPTSDLARARATFTPAEIKITRGGQKLEWRKPAGGAPVVFALRDDAVEIPAVTFDLATPNGFKGAFGVRGAVRKLTSGGDLALEAELSPIDLGILVGIVPRLTRAQGTLSGSVKLSGKASQPGLAGQMKVRGAEFGFKGLPGAISDVDIDVVADENEARVTKGTGKFLGGDVALTGRMPLKGGQLGVLEGDLVARQLYVAPVEGVKATVDADLHVTMNPQAVTAVNRLPFVGGEVNITSFEYTKPITLELNGITGTAKRTNVEAYDPTLDAITLGFDVRSRVPLRIRNNLVEANLQIEAPGIHVSGTNQRIGLRGELTTTAGGRFRVFANDFELRKGSIRFDDPTRIAPKVDITATTEYRRYSSSLNTGAAAATAGAAVSGGSIASGASGGNIWRITLHAYGDADNLQVDMTSDPALSREDIFFLLTIGLTRAEVDQVQAGSVYASAAFEAIGTVSGVDRAVKQAIPVIDDFRPGTAYSPRTGRVEPNITVGRRLTENIRARLTSGLAEDPQLRSTIEWRLNRSVTVEPSYDRIDTVSSSNVGNFGIDFRWRLEFD